jgi:hypothetical protein
VARQASRSCTDFEYLHPGERRARRAGARRSARSVGARRAGQLHVRHGGWIAVTSTALGGAAHAARPARPRPASIPLWVEVTTWLLILPAGMTGGARSAAVSRARAE